MAAQPKEDIPLIEKEKGEQLLNSSFFLWLIKRKPHF